MRAQLGIARLIACVELLVANADAGNENAPYLVISIADHQLWYKQGNQVLFYRAPVATASGKELVGGASRAAVAFETPRGRLVVQGQG